MIQPTKNKIVIIGYMASNPPREPKVVGEGTFGCVIDPSLECADKKTPDPNSNVSKVMLDEDAEKEMSEYTVVDKIDPKMQYHIGNPTKCRPAPTNKAKNVIDECEDFNAADIDEYAILVMENGGKDLAKFAAGKKHTKQSVSQFWKEARNILEGLLLLKRNHVAHHDLKPQNIVYSKHMKMIDFGKLSDQDRIKRACSASVYKRSIMHFSYPPELYFINKDFYLRFAKHDADAKRQFASNFEEMISAKCAYFFSLVRPVQPLWLKNELRKMIMNELKPERYDEFLNKSIDTIDTYGAGLSFLYVLRRFESYMPAEIVDEMRSMFKFAVHPNVFLRYNAETLLKEYDELMENWHHASTPQSDDFHISPPTVPVAEVPKPPLSVPPGFLQKAFAPKSESALTVPPGFLQKVFAPKSDIDSVSPKSKKKCPSSHERNPNTGRCNKKCGKWSRRNEQFKCVRAPTVKRKAASLNTVGTWKCPGTDERNPITGRCNKKCGKLSRRNEKFKCVRNITMRNN